MTNLEILGFVEMDLTFLITALCFGGIGALVDYVCKRNDFKNLPVNNIPEANFKVYAPLFLSRVFIGCVGGGLIWLVLYGILRHDAQSYVRLIILAFMSGLSAPALIKSYQKKALKAISAEEENTRQ
ncbi:hypothetical protein JFJ09_07345 [Pseudoalteromonas arctica]|uniref:hypothetical protein n=1 Tax=Pseudoalteromonas arctica TaxID=394751 RepID=UPI001C9C75A1|nr:hypothetical protein [Pseudoalteromonas arctica]MBZ2192030.1 hypothetical protein [Pseudoalteromonas arctica]